jgi:hypothetical protein
MLFSERDDGGVSISECPSSVISAIHLHEMISWSVWISTSIHCLSLNIKLVCNSSYIVGQIIYGWTSKIAQHWSHFCSCRHLLPKMEESLSVSLASFRGVITQSSTTQGWAVWLQLRKDQWSVVTHNRVIDHTQSPTTVWRQYLAVRSSGLAFGKTITPFYSYYLSWIRIYLALKCI